MIETIFKYSDSIQNFRTISDVMIYATSELGELAEEVNIRNGYSSKEEGKDGIVGEAVDCIICLMDLIKQAETTITEKELMDVFYTKLDKWKEKSNAYT